ncbi:MAG: SUF system NifU family Fe-S cluster assembly protein [Beggiatoa sp.]|nr:SUF system NifU family Fe-S cluster assembly protein [Beggiatoa sp.]
MFDLKALYQEVIIDHNRHPRNCHRLADADRVADGFNPLCGDRLTVYLKLQDGVIADVAFEGEGCAISVASASLMTEHLKGKTEAEAQAVFDRFRALVMGEEEADTGLDKLVVLAGVKEFPARVKCATLAWHTLTAALKDRREPVSTE